MADMKRSPEFEGKSITGRESKITGLMIGKGDNGKDRLSITILTPTRSINLFFPIEQILEIERFIAQARVDVPHIFKDLE